MLKRPRVVVTGMGLVTPCGVGTEATWANLVAGRSGVVPISLFDASRLETRFAAEVPAWAPEQVMDRKQARRLDRYQQFALAAATEAVRDAALDTAHIDATRAAVIVGSCVGGLAGAELPTVDAHARGPQVVSPFFILNVLINMAASHLSIHFGFKGPAWSLSSACATSAHALGEGMRLIQRGEADVVLAGGAEAPIGFMCIAGFNAMRALSTRNDDPARASRPFDAARDGFVLGEGAGIVVLESEEHARRRGARIHAELAGYGATADAFHVTAPAADHEGAQRCMRTALEDAQLTPADIGYVNAHGTSTPLGDVAEAQAIAAVFREHAGRVAVSSTKSMTGHLTGAAGAMEAIASILTLTRDMAPPTINLDTPDPAVTLDCIPHTARALRTDAVMSNAFGFGGTNACLVFARHDADHARA